MVENLNYFLSFFVEVWLLDFLLVYVWAQGVAQSTTSLPTSNYIYIFHAIREPFQRQVKKDVLSLKAPLEGSGCGF